MDTTFIVEWARSFLQTVRQGWYCAASLLRPLVFSCVFYCWRPRTCFPVLDCRGPSLPQVSPAKVDQLMWRSRRERASWLACVAAAVTTPRLAYCAGVLSHLAEQPVAAAGRGGKAGRK